MCSDCSSFLFFETSQRKHRVCSACAADHSNATRAARQSQRDALFESTSDVEPELTADAIGTPSSVASNTRGGFRASVMHAITPSSGAREKKKKEKRKKNSATSKAQQSAVATSELAGNDAVAANGRSHVVGPGLFNTAGDTWFTEPADEDEGKRKQKPTSDMGRAFPDADYSDEFADSTNSTSRTAADEWRDQVKATYELQLDQSARVGEAAPPSGFGFGRATFSEQYRYDDDPLEYEEDDKTSEGYPNPSSSLPSMPRPEPVVNFESEPKPAPKANTSRRSPPAEEPDHLRQSILKVNLKGLFHGKSKKEKREQRKKTKEGRAERAVSQRNEEKSPVGADRGARKSLDQRMTLDELESTVKPLTVGASTMRPTFYDDDVDELVVDDTPGYFEANVAETSADKRRQEELQRKLAEDAAWVNGAAAPTLGGNRFSSGQESYSIVDAPSHGTSSPESAANNTPSALAGSHEDDKAKEHGLTGALKRFFGMSTAAKALEKTPVTTTKEAPEPARTVSPPGPSQTPTPGIEKMPSRRSIADNYVGDRTLSFRHSFGDMDQMPAYEREDGRDLAALRFTMAGNLDAQNSLRPGTFMVPGTEPERLPREPRRKKSNKSLKRRDTFDDLFESPKAVDRHNEASSGRPTQAWGAVAVENTPAYSVVVDRFDAYRDDREGEADEFMPASRTSHVRSSDAYRDSPSDARYISAPTLKSRRESDDAFESPTKPTSVFTWNNVQATSGFGTATYAVPSGVPPRDSRFGGDRFASTRAASDDESAVSPHNIMEDLHRRSMSGDVRRNRTTAGSVDDIFAQFERPNDYVFDPATGSYIPSRPPPRASRREKKASSAPRQIYEMDEVVETRSSIGRRPSDHRRSDSSHSVKSVEPRVVRTSADDSDSNGSDDMIVDKISSLEGELAALKRLIKKRKGDNSSTDAPRSAPRQSKPRAPVSVSSKPRKESIFDGDSSESDKEVPGARWPTASARSKTGEKMKMPQRKVRRDSFASLFDDDPAEDNSIAGGGGYDALFQTEPNKSDESDDDEKAKGKTSTVRRSKKRSSKKLSNTVAEAAADDFDAPDEDEEELTSLKNKRGASRQRRRSSKERTTPTLADDSPDEAVGTVSLATERVPEVKPKSAARASSSKMVSAEEEDPIDALFDTSTDADMTDLYGDVMKSDSPPGKAPSRRASSRNSKTRRRLSDGDSDEDDHEATLAVAAIIPSEPAERRTSSSSLALNSGVALTPASISTSDGSDSEEEFAINWKKVKSGRARRQTRPSESQVSFVSITGTDLIVASDEEAEPTIEPYQEVGTTPASSPEGSGDIDEDGSGDQAHLAISPSEPISTPRSEELVATELDRVDAEKSSVLDNTSVPVTSDMEANETDHAGPSGDQSMPAEPAAAVETSAVVDDASPSTPLTKPAFVRSRVADDLFLGEAEDDEDSMGLFDRSNDVDLHSLMGGGASTAYDGAFAISTPDTRSAPLSSALAGERVIGDDSSSGEESGGDAGFSFEIRPQRRKTPAPIAVEISASRISSIASSSTADGDDNGSLLLGRYARAPPSQTDTTSLDDSSLLSASVSSLDSSAGVDAEDDDADPLKSKADGDAAALGSSVSADSAEAFDADWQAMQEQEKQRKKKLQMKQRQAQRDKLMLKKQHSKMLTSGANDGGAPDSKSGKKQKKKKKTASKDDAAPSSRKHRHREKADKDSGEPAPASNAASGSLTEL